MPERSWSQSSALRRPILAILVALLLLFCIVQARAEQIYLKNGFVIDGWIVEESPQTVVAVIRNGTLGHIWIDPADIDHIDRTRAEPLEKALARYFRERAAAQAAAAKAREAGAAEPKPPDRTPRPVPAEPAKPATPIPPPTPEQAAKIESAVRELGDTRKEGGAGTRRENAVRDLVEVGPVAIPALDAVLDDQNRYRRMDAEEWRSPASRGRNGASRSIARRSRCS